MALEADVFSDGCCLFLCITFVTKSPAIVFDETQIRERQLTNFTVETEWVPVVIHGFDDTSDDEFTAFSTTGSIQDVKIMFTILPALELVKDGILSKGLEALSTNETALVPDFSSCETRYQLTQNFDQTFSMGKS